MTDQSLLVLDEEALAQVRAAAPLHDPRDAANLERVLENLTGNHRVAEAKSVAVSRELVETLGVLKKAEASAKKLCGNAAIAQRIDELREAVQSLKKEETTAARIAKSMKDAIDRFLDEGPKGLPTNGEMIKVARELEKLEREAGL